MSSIALREQANWIVEHWRPYRRQAAALVVLTVTEAGIIICYPWLLKLIIDGIQRNATYREILSYVGILLAVGLFDFLLYRTMQTLRAGMNLKFQFGVRMRAFEHLLRMGPTFFSQFRTGDLVTRLNDDVNEKLAWYMCSGIFRLLEACAIIAFAVSAMLSINPYLTLYTAGPLPILIGLFVFTAGTLHKRYAEVQETISQLNDSLESCFSGIRVVKAFTAEDVQMRLVDEAIERQREAEIRAVRWQTVIDTLYGNIWQMAIIGVLLAGGAMAMTGKVSIGDIVAFDTYVLILIWPMFDIGQFLVRGRLAGVSIGRIKALEEATPEVDEPSREAILPRRPEDAFPPDYSLALAERPQLTVTLEDVAYRYPQAAEETAREISFSARPGDITALVGEIASGKSTLLALVPRLVEPTAGHVFVGDSDVRDWDPIALRQAMGYVPQEPYLFSGTVRENIRFGRSWVSDADIEMAIRVAQLHPDLAEWQDGLETVVGSRGIRISGGQKQRVSLARALAGRPAVLLLDDCTASLDADTEERVWQEMLAAIPGCTTLLVTHRPSTLEKADQILVLDRGRIRERGTFRQLNQNGTHFHQLYIDWKLQEDMLG